jgi:lysozyme family protein
MVHDLSACLAHTMSYEGLFVNDTRDPGGPTNYGITFATLRAIRKSATVQQLRALTPDDAQAIYRTLYYVPVGAELLPAGVDLMAGDMAVNAGVLASARILQQALGLTQDGHVGPVTIRAAVAADPTSLIVAMGVLQASFYRGLGNFSAFGTGWLNRVRDRQIAALSMAHTVRAAA